MVGFDLRSAAGTLLSGASTATLVALATAREAKGLKARDHEKSVIYLAESTHSCVLKAIKIAGLSEAIIRLVDIDHEFRMEVECLERHIEADKQKGLRPFLLVAAAGTGGKYTPLEL